MVQKVVTTKVVSSRKKAKTARKAAKVAVKVPRPIGVDPFLKCVFGPVSQALSAMGVPDGDPRPSFTLDHRSVITVRPDSGGNVSVALMPSVDGCWAVLAGKSKLTVDSVDASNGVCAGTYDLDWSETTGFGTENPYCYRVVPFAEWLAPAGTVMRDDGGGQQGVYGGGMCPEAFRVITNTGTVTYVGPPLTATGVVSSARLDLHVDKIVTESARYSYLPAGQDAAYGSVLALLCEEPPNSFALTAVQPGAVTAAVTSCQKLINVPTKWDYTPIQLAYPISPAAGTNNPTCGRFCAWSGATNKAITMPMGGMGLAPTTVYTATGLDPSAVLVFDGRSCIQYTINRRSQVRHMANPSPPARPGVLDTIQRIAPRLPAAAPSQPSSNGDSGWLGNALGWYGDTMKKAIGGAWDIGSDLIGAILPGKAGQDLSGLGHGLSKLMIGN